VNSGGMAMVKTGAGEADEGGVRVIDDLKREREIVSETGRRANEAIG